ncbi:MAG: DUF2132 domain-containing protein [Gammaproteobacteria bacterium]|nr:DUF2132 domain-containing protein [Gammaproteobacteria bacterium]
MNNKINFKTNSLNGVGLKAMLIELVSHYGFDILFAYLKNNCFKTNPSIESRIKFLKKTEWAREKVEVRSGPIYRTLLVTALHIPIISPITGCVISVSKR